MEKQRFQILEYTINAAGDVVNIDDNTKIEHKKVTSIFVVATSGDYDVNLRGSKLELSIDGNEILPKDFEAGLIRTNMFVSRPEAEMLIDERAENSKIVGTFTDGGSANSGGILNFYPYKLQVYLKTSV